MLNTNRLVKERSPYLLQHAHNPVDWYAWGEEAFARARREDKPIFLSVGYSTCHWCHVMERESFENPQIAEILNRDFVSIKVDREERPDVDRIYMTFVQATSGSGGWPMSVWLTPQLQPFYGGTYFPPESHMGRPGFASVLRQITAAWQAGRGRILDSAREITGQLQKFAVRQGNAAEADAELLDRGFQEFRRTYDRRTGGFGSAPKFPRPSVFSFLLRYWHATRNPEALEMCLFTLRQMADGGIQDQLGGGFHRYSVDDRWFTPHFEKMLYDQAQLAISYVQAFQVTREEQYADTARRTLDYVLHEMTAGGFYSAEDADSAPDAARPTDKREGAFYVWTAEEIAEHVGDAAPWFNYRYGVEPGGNVEQDPHGEFAGHNILYRAHTVEETAAQFGVELGAVAAALRDAEAALRKVRARRPRPQLDDKILAAWNGLMISAFALAGAALNEPRYSRAAREAADFVLARMYKPETGQLLRVFCKGAAAAPGFLEDYAFFAQGLLDLYETQFQAPDLEVATRLTERQLELFEDRENGGFFSAAEDPALVLRLKDHYDGAEPAGSSVAVMNLLRLARMRGRSDFERSAQTAMAQFAHAMGETPSAAPQMLAALDFSLRPGYEVVLAGPSANGFAAALHSRFTPNKVALLVDSTETRRRLAEGLPPLASLEIPSSRAAAYVCRNFTCHLPVFESGRLTELLQ